jgi:archaellum component FlaC
MNISTYRFTLDLREEASQVMLSARKGDKRRRLAVRFSDGGTPYSLPGGCYAVFGGVRPDGAVIVGDCIVNGDVVLYDLDGALASVTRCVDCDITLFDADGAELTAPKFGITVYDTATSTPEIETTEEYKTLSALVTETRQIHDESVEFAEELTELRDSIHDELKDANETIAGFNDWYEETADELERITEESDTLVKETTATCEKLVSDTEAALREFTSVGESVTIPTAAWNTDAGLSDTKSVLVGYIGNNGVAVNALDPSGVPVGPEFGEYSATVKLTQPLDQFILRLQGGASSSYIQPYDIANVQLINASGVNVLPEDIAELGWAFDLAWEKTDKAAVAFEDNLKYIHVFRQSNYAAQLLAFTGVELPAGTYTLKLRMRTACSKYIAAVALKGITEHSSTVVAPVASSALAVTNSGVRPFAQRSGELFFTCGGVPTEAVSFNVTATTGYGGVIINCSNGGDGMALIWENTNTDGTFEPQAITLQDNRYERYLIQFSDYKKLNESGNPSIAKGAYMYVSSHDNYVGEQYDDAWSDGHGPFTYEPTAMVINENELAYRSVILGENGFYFSAAQIWSGWNSVNTDNSRMIPVRVYGISGTGSGGASGGGGSGTPGKDGITPHIGENGNWFIGDEDTGVAAGGSGGGSEMTLLWENAAWNTYMEFAPQTLTVDAGYTKYLVQVVTNMEISYMFMQRSDSQIGYYDDYVDEEYVMLPMYGCFTAVMSTGSSSSVYFRTFRLNANDDAEITVETGYLLGANSATQDNTACAPWRIYGIK